ncbi:MAG: excinuclease ABC subunit UvrA [Tidjanibacter sp.]|nr:excinuclease ABC subunit UvrA [Tidjanibacter sp.]
MDKQKRYDSIYIKGARVHNLKNVTLEIPHNKLVVVTGLSGSGKSTLAFDTIFAEGQRRYVESLSAYARQFMGKIDKPQVDLIEGIAPAIAIQQHINNYNPRSTVGTTTEIYEYLKLLFARVGHTFSPVTGEEVKCYTQGDVADYVVGLPESSRVLITAPLLLREGQGVIERLTLLVKDGLQRVWYGGRMRLIEDVLPEMTERTSADELDIIVDRVVVSQENDVSTIEESVARALELGDGICSIITLGEESDRREFSTRFEADGITFEQSTEHLFSFNSPLGACPKCDGYGKVTGIDEDLVVPDKNKSIYDDAIACWRGETMGRWKDQLVLAAHKFDFPVHAPYYELTREQKQLLWRGNSYFKGLDEFFQYISKERYKIQYRVMLSRFTGKTICPECGGRRLRPEALYVQVGGKNIAEMVEMPVEDLVAFFDELKMDAYDAAKSERILVEIKNRLQYLTDVGLGYLTLNRLSSTLSGGESQRIALSSALGNNLTGSLYILDEPSIGLHPRDTARLIEVLKRLRDLGNTVIVVEHEEEIIRAADHIVDIGPGAGYNGGEVVYNGPFEGLKTAEGLTADYMMGRKSIPMPVQVRGWNNYIEIKGARQNNLKGVDIKIPLNVMTCITGVSGSGKSSFVKGILYPAVRRKLNETGLKPGTYDSLEGDLKLLESIEIIDQNPIGTSLRSNPVTYTKAYNTIRRLFAAQPYAENNGLTQGHFSFNRAGGRCEECQGEGVIKVEMQFMADVEIKCERCGGRRFSDEVLEVRYRGKSIYDVLEMTVDDAVAFFGEDKEPMCVNIVNTLSVLQEVGLGYVKLGQPTSTLSGGEIQRVKLASFLLKDDDSGKTLFIFDEPTTGLHIHDISTLMKAFDALIARGNTVVIVEHNIDVIKCADWVVDLGPEGGAAGGRVVFEGTPQELALCKESYTGRYLAMRNKIVR